jgi:hypothetical protein
MDATEAAKATLPAVVELPAKFMMDGNTYKRGAELGFDGVDFYVAGRGGVLGDVDADIVSAAFVYFNPASVRRAWEASATVCSRGEAAEAFAACAHGWAGSHLADGPDYARLAELLGKVVAAASAASAPLFAGWRHLDVPGDPKAAVVHQLNALRELRGGLHGGAVLAAGMTPLQAFAEHSPLMAGIFGWEELPATDGIAPLWEKAEEMTNVALGLSFAAALDDGELDELVALSGDVVAAIQD